MPYLDRYVVTTKVVWQGYSFFFNRSQLLKHSKSQKKASWILSLLGFEIPLGQYLLTDRQLHCVATIWTKFLQALCQI